MNGVSRGVTPVGIVGGGPAGLMLANELGRHGVACVLFEEDIEPPWFPKANSSTARTMEHYRRLGIVDEIRRVGLPPDHSQDVAYFTRYTGGWELARLKGLTGREARNWTAGHDDDWPTPEPVARSNQIFIEPVLKHRAEAWPMVDIRFGWRVLSLDVQAEWVDVAVENVAAQSVESLRFAYVAGCDGPRSMVRAQLGIGHEGVSDEKRLFMGGTMLATRINSPAFYDILGGAPAWQHLAINADRRAIMGALDGKGQFTFHNCRRARQATATGSTNRCG